MADAKPKRAKRAHERSESVSEASGEGGVRGPSPRDPDHLEGPPRLRGPGPTAPGSLSRGCLKASFWGGRSSGCKTPPGSLGLRPRPRRGVRALRLLAPPPDPRASLRSDGFLELARDSRSSAG